MQKQNKTNTFNLYFEPYVKVNSKCIIDLNLKPETKKTLGENFCDFRLNKDILDKRPKLQPKKKTN